MMGFSFCISDEEKKTLKTITNIYTLLLKVKKKSHLM